jgi:hypothetical protein
MATIDRALSAIPLAFDVSPSLRTLDCLNPDRPASPSKANRFLSHLRAESELVVIASRLLRDGTSMGEPRYAAAALEECRAKARSLDASVLRVLRSTLITPLDCEDIKGISRRVRRIVEAVADAGHALVTAESGQRRWLPVQQKVMETAESLVDAMDGLSANHDIVEASRALWMSSRDMSMVLRAAHVGFVRECVGPMEFLAHDAVSRRFSLLCDRFRDVNLLLRKAKLKNG